MKLFFSLSAALLIFFGYWGYGILWGQNQRPLSDIELTRSLDSANPDAPLAKVFQQIIEEEVPNGAAPISNAMPVANEGPISQVLDRIVAAPDEQKVVALSEALERIGQDNRMSRVELLAGVQRMIPLSVMSQYQGLLLKEMTSEGAGPSFDSEAVRTEVLKLLLRIYVESNPDAEGMRQLDVILQGFSERGDSASASLQAEKSAAPLSERPPEEVEH